MNRICYINILNSIQLCICLNSRLPDIFLLLQFPAQTLISSCTSHSMGDFALTFISAYLNVSEQPDLDDLPQKSQDQIGLPLLQVLGPYINHMAPDG